MAARSELFRENSLDITAQAHAASTALSHIAFRENADDITAKQAEVPNIVADFTATSSFDQPAAPSLDATFNEHSRAMDEAVRDRVHETHSQEKMIVEGLLNEQQVSLMTNDSRTGSADSRNSQKKREKEAAQMQRLLNQLAIMEQGIADQFGENFAMDLLTDLYDRGLIDQEDFDRIRMMQDITDQRHAAALVIQNGRNNGTIRDDDLADHSWSQNWLGLHAQGHNLRDQKAAKGNRGELAAEEMGTSAKDEAKHTALTNSPDIQNDFEKATEENAENTGLNNAGFDNLANLDIGGMGDLGAS